jgi:hypothetical protein
VNVLFACCSSLNDNPSRCPSNTRAFDGEFTFPAGRYIFLSVGKNNHTDTVNFQLSIANL